MNSRHFTQIENLFGNGEPPNENWSAITKANLLILVGVTGVGKSRTVEELTTAGLNFTILPNRRILTDHLIIGDVQRMDADVLPGEEPPIIRDRKQRFAYTRRYRERYPGGMAHALSKLWIAEELEHEQLLFDGLRGVNEVESAARHLPHARFIALCAPDGVRIERLLGRNDAFDMIESTRNGGSTKNVDQVRLVERFPDAANIHITPEHEKKLLSLLSQQNETGQGVTEEEMAAKLAIVSEERRNYDPDATLASLQSIAPERLCIVDTVANAPEQCAAQIMAWLS